MTLDLGDEILQDFLVEAGEILEQLNSQLVDLEQNPTDPELLNSVFRGFHTIKGGAGFLSIDSLVDICHRSEDVFNVLRQGQRAVDPELMDAILKALDIANEMFDQVRSGEEPPGADPLLLETLKGFAEPQQEALSGEIQGEPEAESAQEFLQEPEQEATSEAVGEEASEQITEDEFEALLDQLHGKGKHGGLPVRGQ